MNMFARVIRILGGYDWPLTVVVFILSSIGLASIYSIDLSRAETLVYFPTQFISLCIGVTVFFVSASTHKTRYESMARVSYIVGLFFLLLVLFIGATVRGTTGWFRVAGFSFQPVELAKVTLVLLLGWWFARERGNTRKLEFVVSSALAVGLYVLLIMFQPDLGSAAVLVFVWFGLLLLVGVRARYIFILIGAAFLAVVFAWFFLFAGYQKERLLTFLHPERDPLGSGYNVSQSIIAIGSGGVWGRGLGFGSQSQLHFLPEAQTDFIVSVIGEELGFVGLTALLILYAALLWRLYRIARHAKDDFGAYTALGVALMILAQVLVNVGGATGLLPVTGVTLPFVSYGGSSLIMHYLLLGIAASIERTGTR